MPCTKMVQGIFYTKTQQKKRPRPTFWPLCSHSLSSWAGQGLSCRKNMPVACFRQKKAPTFRSGLVFALPIFPGSHPPSIVGVHELNFCVRHVNRWTLMTINTNSYGWVSTHLLYLSPFELRFFGDPYRIRTDVNGVRGRCLNHLTNGPLVHLHGLEPGTH